MAENEPGLLRKGDKVVVYSLVDPSKALEERIVARVAPGKYNGRALWLEGETGPARWDNDGWSRGGGPPLRIVSIAEWQARLAARERDRQCTELREEAHRLGKAILGARGSRDPASFCDEILALLREAIPAWEARAAAAACLISGCKGGCGSEKCRQEWADEQTLDFE